MDKNTEIILNYRQSILDNVGEIYNHYSKKDKQQLSLFGNDDDNFKVDLKVKTYNNYLELLNKEKELLGINISYNPLNRHKLISSRICNSNLKGVFDSPKDNKSLIFLGTLTEIKHMTAKSSGNKYNKLYFEDETGNYEFYLFGEYRKLLPLLFTGRAYLVKCSYSKDRGSAFVNKIEEAELIKTEQYVKSIIIEITSPDKVIQLRQYVFKKMIGTDYDLYFKYLDDTIKAPYKIKITRDIIEELINNGFNLIGE